jgi:hypothetical protein
VGVYTEVIVDERRSCCSLNEGLAVVVSDEVVLGFIYRGRPMGFDDKTMIVCLPCIQRDHVHRTKFKRRSLRHQQPKRSAVQTFQEEETLPRKRRSFIRNAKVKAVSPRFCGNTGAMESSTGHPSRESSSNITIKKKLDDVDSSLEFELSLDSVRTKRPEKNHLHAALDLVSNTERTGAKVDALAGRGRIIAYEDSFDDSSMSLGESFAIDDRDEPRRANPNTYRQLEAIQDMTEEGDEDEDDTQRSADEEPSKNGTSKVLEQPALVMRQTF